VWWRRMPGRSNRRNDYTKSARAANWFCAGAAPSHGKTSFHRLRGAALVIAQMPAPAVREGGLPDVPAAGFNPPWGPPWGGNPPWGTAVGIRHRHDPPSPHHRNPRWLPRPLIRPENGALREGCAPGGPGRRRACRDAEDAGRRVARRWRGAVGNSGIVAYRARSPVARPSAQHAQTVVQAARYRSDETRPGERWPPYRRRYSSALRITTFTYSRVSAKGIFSRKASTSRP
jgi:hypothetical protein